MNLATIGRGPIVEDALRALEEVDGLQPTAVYSRKMEDAIDFAGRHGIEKTYDDLDQLLKDPDIDVIYIASPNSLHHSQARKALEAGKNVILEKPFVSSLEQAEDLFETAERNGVMIFEAITTTHHRNFRKLREQLERIGNPKQAVLNFSQYSSRYDAYRQGKVTNAFDPAFDGGALMDIGLYNIQLALGLFGKPEKVSYFPNRGFNGIDTSGILLLEYPNLIVTSIAAKDSGPIYEAIIAGDEGSMIIDDGGVNQMKRVRFLSPKGEEEEISTPVSHRMIDEFRDFVHAMENNDRKAYEDWKRQTLQVMEVLQEAKRQRDSIAG